MRLLVVVPTYCEKETIATVLRRIRTALPGADILVVDDQSPDGTADLAEKAGVDLGGVHVLRRDGRRGLGSAYRSGYAWGLAHGYEMFCAMDADLSHDPDVLPKFVAALDGHDVVVGSRYIPGGSVLDWSWHRRALSRAGNWYSSWMLGLPVHDLTSGFHAYRAEILPRHRPRDGQSGRLRVSDRDDLPGRCGRRPVYRDPDLLRGPVAGQVEDVGSHCDRSAGPGHPMGPGPAQRQVAPGGGQAKAQRRLRAHQSR